LYALRVPALQFVILSKQPAGGNGLPPIGSRSQLIKELSQYNTAPERDGDTEVLYGPGIRLEFPPATGSGRNADDVSQLLLTVTEEEIAWLVIMRLAKDFDWKIVDTSSGRELNA